MPDSTQISNMVVIHWPASLEVELQGMLDAGLIDVDPEGHYTVTPAGEAAMDAYDARHRKELPR